MTLKQIIRFFFQSLTQMPYTSKHPWNFLCIKMHKMQFNSISTCTKFIKDF